MAEFWQTTFDGLTTGAVYVLVAVGLTLGIGVARFLNFAQGQLVFLGTLGFGIIIEYTVVLIWGADQRSVPTPLTGHVRAGGVLMSDNSLLLLGISVPVMILLY